ncbi:hypothetical protein HY989_03745 [Candidatus Micrarchaeota archaeon]|nr:hypothetical protein [Candidatus Micrarchaeota archaeon]
MEHSEKRRKLYNNFVLLIVAFLLIALLAISGFYGGVLFGLPLGMFAWGFVAIDLGIIAYAYKLISDEEKLESHSPA